MAGARVVVAMSGGVDSSVAALLSEGEVVAVTLELWRDAENDGERSCCSADAVREARALAHRMGLPHFTLDLRDEFRAGVVDPWLAGHAGGLTPNPCVGCNGHVRLDAMLAFADRLGAATLTTGHYARRTPDGLLRQAADTAKDQSYMLAALSRASLARLRFPLGDMETKAEVRDIARAAGLPVASKADSQDLCFLAGTGRARFLARHGALRERPGDIVDRAGRRLGRHRGHHHFTVGQRRGLGIGGEDEPLYVLETDARANTVTVGPKTALATTTVRLRGVRLHTDAAEVDAVKLRYRAPAVGCTLADDTLTLTAPVHGVAPGQVACLLRGDVVVGCATIVV
jgi:tRNA-uridine 2-sulfurtransferase